MKDLLYWRTITHREWRDLHPPLLDVCHNNDATDVRYDGTLGNDMGAGKLGFWEGHEFWESSERQKPITFRQLGEVHLLLHR